METCGLLGTGSARFQINPLDWFVIPVLVIFILLVVRKRYFGRHLLQCSAAMDVWILLLSFNLICTANAHVLCEAGMGHTVFHIIGCPPNADTFGYVLVIWNVVQLLPFYLCIRWQRVAELAFTQPVTVPTTNWRAGLAFVSCQTVAIGVLILEYIMFVKT